MAPFVRLSEHLYLFSDTCNVYVITSGHSAVAIDFGSGAVLPRLSEIGVDRIEYILHTHHHRDQAQGDPLALAAGAKVLVPEAEQDLFTQVDQLWATREVFNNYKVRQDRFSVREPISISDILRDLDRWTWREYEFLILPTPGHTTGSISLSAMIDGRRVAFTGDLIYGPGKVWNLAATQWTYNGHQGVLASLYSLSILEQNSPDLLCPSHGQPMSAPPAAMAQLAENLEALCRVRNQGLEWRQKIQNPWRQILPHLLVNTLSQSNSYLLLADKGHGLMIDAGYQFSDIQVVSGFDRAARRILPPPLGQLQRQFGLTKIDVVIPTHYHDDHVGAIPTLRRLYGTQSWVPENFSSLLAAPKNFDLPCLWFDPIPVDRELPLNTSVSWRGYELRIFPLPGHTEFAVAVSFEVDGKNILAIGDQHYNDPYLWNYVYQNRFTLGAYAAGFSLYRKLKTDLILTGHLAECAVTPDLLDAWSLRAEELDAIHRKLLPLEEFDWDAHGMAAYIQPYQIDTAQGETFPLTVVVKNPLSRNAPVSIKVITPLSWKVEPASPTMSLAPHQWGSMNFLIQPPPETRGQRIPLTADITIDDRPFGQQAECLVNVHL